MDDTFLRKNTRLIKVYLLLFFIWVLSDTKKDKMSLEYKENIPEGTDKGVFFIKYFIPRRKEKLRESIIKI